ncbi:DUF6653 family protein [Saliphagus sp. GCM10025334]
MLLDSFDRVMNGSERTEDRPLWSRHANPWSVWTFVVAYPTLIVALYRRNQPLLAGTLLFVLVNPLVSPPATTDDAWATRVVLGERVWIERGLASSRETHFAAACAPVYLYTIRAAVERQPVRTAAGTLFSLLFMLAFFRRMVRLYESEALAERS